MDGKKKKIFHIHKQFICMNDYIDPLSENNMNLKELKKTVIGA